MNQNLNSRRIWSPALETAIIRLICKSALASVANLSIVGLFAECISPPPRAFVTPIVPGQKNEIVQPVESGSFGIFGWVSSESLHAIWRTEIVSPPCISRLQSRSLLVHRSSAYGVLMRNRDPGQKRHTSVFIRPVIINPYHSEVFSRTHAFFLLPLLSQISKLLDLLHEP